jgi:hypothetical protein
MKILGTETMSTDEVNFELQRGARFVIYEYCISLLIITFKRSSDIYFIRMGESRIGKGLGFWDGGVFPGVPSIQLPLL